MVTSPHAYVIHINCTSQASQSCRNLKQQDLHASVKQTQLHNRQNVTILLFVNECMCYKDMCHLEFFPMCSFCSFRPKSISALTALVQLFRCSLLGCKTFTKCSEVWREEYNQSTKLLPGFPLGQKKPEQASQEEGEGRQGGLGPTPWAGGRGLEEGSQGAGGHNCLTQGREQRAEGWEPQMRNWSAGVPLACVSACSSDHKQEHNGNSSSSANNMYHQYLEWWMYCHSCSYWASSYLTTVLTPHCTRQPTHTDNKNRLDNE